MAAASAPCPLLDLTPELFELIAVHLPGADLKTMRLASRVCHFQVEKTFGEVGFGHVSVLLCDEKSLQMLGNISAHKRYGAAVKHLTLLIGELPGDYRPELAELENTPNFDQWIALRAAQQQLTHSGLGAALLKAALKSFASHGKLRGLRVRSETFDTLESGGPTANTIRQLESFGDLSLAPPDPRESRHFTSIVNIIADSNLKLKTMSVITNFWSIFIEEGKTMKRSVIASQRFKDRLHRCLLNVESLCLPLWTDEAPTDRFIHKFCSHIAKAPSLRHLWVVIQSGSDEKNKATGRYLYDSTIQGSRRIAPALMTQTFSKLEQLTVCSHDKWASVIKLEDVKSFVSRHKSLEHLALYQMFVEGLDYSGSEDGQKKLGPILGIGVTMIGHF